MTQPNYVPLTAADRVRPSQRFPSRGAWRADRPAEIVSPDLPAGSLLGNPGPDQGYALKLVRQYEGRLQLAAGEHHEDAVAGGLAVALKRAAVFGRAPVVHDFELAFTLWGYLGDAPAELVAHRRHMFDGASHTYWAARAIADAVSDDVLRLTPGAVRERLGDWRSLLAA